MKTKDGRRAESRRYPLLAGGSGRDGLRPGASQALKPEGGLRAQE